MGDESPPEVPAPAEVEPGLWTCAEVAVPAALADASLGITHLVSIGCPPPDDPTGGVRTVETLRLDLEDDDDGDLLTQIPDTVAFIRGGLSACQRGSPPGETSGDGAADAPDAKSVGGVLVHCHAGQSRSVAVAMAHIMRARGLEVAEALRVCQKNNPAASPNAGFIAQLTLWSSMDCKLNMADEAYRMYVVAKMAREREYNGYVQATSVRPDPGLSSSWLSSSGAANVMPFVGTDAASLAPVGPPNGGGAEAGVAISCRKCRRLLARGANTLPHTPGEGMDARSWRARSRGTREISGGGIERALSNAGSNADLCRNVFLEPLAWMKGVEEGPTEGKLCCPKCDAKVGHFNWVGIRCGCGAWVAPAFYVQSAKVDVMPYTGT